MGKVSRDVQAPDLALAGWLVAGGAWLMVWCQLCCPSTYGQWCCWSIRGEYLNELQRETVWSFLSVSQCAGGGPEGCMKPERLNALN